MIQLSVPVDGWGLFFNAMMIISGWRLVVGLWAVGGSVVGGCGGRLWWAVAGRGGWRWVAVGGGGRWCVPVGGGMRVRLLVDRAG